jgi:polyketide synthase 12
VELRNRLRAATGVRLHEAVVFDHPSATAMTDHLLRELQRTATPPDTGPDRRPAYPDVLESLRHLKADLAALRLQPTERADLVTSLRDVLSSCSADTDTDPAAAAEFERADAFPLGEANTASEVLDFINGALGIVVELSTAAVGKE